MTRSDTRLKAMRAKELPYALNTSLLYDALRDTPKDRGLGKVLLQAMQAAQGNFDHYQSQVEALRRIHNEHGEETNYLKDQLVPHDHPRMDRSIAPGTGWYAGVNQLMGGIDEQQLFETNHFTPTFISETCSLTRVSIWIGNDGAGLADLRFAIYAGDNEGNYPGSLITSLPLIDYFGAGAGAQNYWWGFPEDGSPNVELGPGYYWFGAQRQGAGSALEIDCADAHGGYNGIIQGGQYDYDFDTQWPFPALDAAGEQLGTMGLHMNTWAVDAEPPAWAGDDVLDSGDFELSQWASGIAFKVV